MNDEDLMCMFAQECLLATDNPEDRMGRKDAYSAYSKWQKKDKQRPKMNPVSFTIAFSRYAGEPEKTRSGAYAHNVWPGWKVLSNCE